jgi:uncharacterized protein (TIGR02757 family)
MHNTALKEFLDRKADQYEQPGFVPGDPLSIPHRFTLKQDIEIAAFFAAILAWGQRTSIINSCNRLLQLMRNAPYEFVLNFKEADLKPFLDFVHRTFNGTDAIYFLHLLQYHYRHHSSLEHAFVNNMNEKSVNVADGLNGFYNYFFSLPYYPERSRKHIAAPAKDSACKRLNMFLRWMVRSSDKGVDFGIWTGIKSSQLICPLDTHSGRVARKLGLLLRRQDDWKAATELTDNLKILDAADPVKYDYALFGMGVEEKY